MPAERRRLASVMVSDLLRAAQTRRVIAGHRAPMLLEAVTVVANIEDQAVARTVEKAVVEIEAAGNELLWYAQMKG